MDTFNSIKYQKFSEETIDNSSELYKKPVIYRKLNIIPEEASDSSELYLKKEDINDNNDNIMETNLDNNDPIYSINLNSTMPYFKEKPVENKYFDSETMTSFNDLNDFNSYNSKTINELNDIRYAGNIENLRLEVDDNKNILRSNIQKLSERDDRLENIEEKSNLLLKGSNKFNSRTRNLYYLMFMKYIYHIIGIILMLIVIIIMIVSLVNN